MRWILAISVLLAASSAVLSRHRPKRDLSYIKNLIATKLFGTETIVIQMPEIPKNEPFRLYKVQGYDNILIKVSHKSTKKSDEKEAHKPGNKTEKEKNPVIVNPEIAIIGSYLGTSTQGETLLAIELAKKLLKSGILNGKQDKVIQEIVVPLTPQVTHRVNVGIHEYVKPAIEAERDRFVVLPPIKDSARRVVINQNPVPVISGQLPPVVVASEFKVKPFQTKYSYQQKGVDADMTYESYNNQDVIVTRTTKAPSLPEHIKLRIAEVASIGANTYLVRSPYPASMPPYFMERMPAISKPAPSLEVVGEEVGYVVVNSTNNSSNVSNSALYPKPLAVPDFMKHSRLRSDFEKQSNSANANKLKQYKSQNMNITKNSDYTANPPVPLKLSIVSEGSGTKKDKIKDSGDKNNEIWNKTDTNGEIVTKYLYKQINHNSNNKHTVAKLGEPPKLSHVTDNKVKTNIVKTNTVKNVDEVPKDFIFVPPKDVNVPFPNFIAKTNNMSKQNPSEKSDDLDNLSSETKNYPKISVLNRPRGDNDLKTVTETIEELKTSDDNSLKNNPIVVLEDSKAGTKRNRPRIYKGGKKGRRPYTGGPVF